ncbi:MAG: hypothetical protein HQL07_05295 [Nitrospirae bacterium]|nr:hypothetical protein [Magnetococcales bacterium]
MNKIGSSWPRCRRHRSIRLWATMGLGLFLGMISRGVVADDRGKTFLLIMDAPTQPASTWSWELLKRSQRMDAVVENLRASFALPQSLTIHFSDGEGPSYDPKRTEITLPYSFVANVARHLSNAPPLEGNTALQADTLDVVEWVLYHELAHAFIHLYDLPVLGREEDAADALATFLVIELVENGGHIALTAADLLAHIAPYQHDDAFWSEHTLDQQRFSQVVCWVYGSDTTQFAPLAKSGTIPRHRAQRCPDAFMLMAEGWWRLLDRFIKSA